MPSPSLILVSTERRRRPSSSPLAFFLLPLLLLATSLLAPPALAKGPTPAQSIPLESLGFQSIAPRYLLSGGTIFTLDYVDNEHLLVTFGVARLMKRLPDSLPDDQDRVVDAVLLELPSGRELARAEWRLRDIGQYLWPIGHGHFLLRQRNQLTTFAPLAQLPSGDAFGQHPFLHFENSIDAIYVSADRDLLTIETSKHARKPDSATQLTTQPAGSPSAAGVAAVPPTSLGPSQPTRPLTLRRRNPSQTAQSSAHPGDSDDPDHPIRINFIRLLSPTKPGGSLLAQHAGYVDARRHLVIPLTSEGYLRTRDHSNAGVTLDFATFSGKVTDLGGFDTSCPPSPIFLTASEFVAFGCRGSEDRLTLAGFNIHGDLMWQLLFSDTQAYPSFSAANSAGRFAFSRTLLASPLADFQAPSADQLSAQEVRVLQTYNGKQLLRVNTSPIQRSGQNFALSPDGLSLAIIHDPVDPHLTEVQHKPAIEIYALPPLSDKDRHEVDAEAALAPPRSEAPIVFSLAQVKESVAAAHPGPAATQTDPKAALLPTHAKVPPLPLVAPPPGSAAADSHPAGSFVPVPATPLASSSEASLAADEANPAAREPIPATGEPGRASGQAQGGDPPAPHRKPPTLYDPAYDGDHAQPGPPDAKPPQQ
ncbi:MAG TPA: hypothetical protein VNW54_09600 [Granulicella sp.]|jgi:hypothetical protein|nr:hypothetical protein [Granulicella sp.]